VIQTCVGLVNFKNPLLKSMAQDFLLMRSDSELDKEETDQVIANAVNDNI